MKFGGKPTMKDKMKMVEKKGYDSGILSKGQGAKPKPKAKPLVEKKRVGIKIEKKL